MTYIMIEATEPTRADCGHSIPAGHGYLATASCPPSTCCVWCGLALLVAQDVDRFYLPE